MVSIVILSGFATLAILLAAHHAYQLRKHVGWKRTDFIVHFESAGIQPDVSGVVYDQFQPMGVWKNFCPAPSDSIEHTYKIADEDVEDSLQEIIERLGCEMPSSRILKRWERPIETLGDIVEWVDWVKKNQ
jgi:hypothetical protein